MISSFVTAPRRAVRSQWWGAVLMNYDVAQAIPHIARYAGPGGWNDLDMLEAGA